MNRPIRFLCVASLVLSLLAPCAALADPGVIYLVRHGEKEASGKDPALTADGQARARNIATILQKAGVKYQLIVGADGVVTTVLLTSVPATGPAQ